MFFDDRNTDWETREDASTIARFKAIEADPERMRKAQECIKKSVREGQKALGIKVAPPVPGRKNPATIMSLNTNKMR